MKPKTPTTHLPKCQKAPKGWACSRRSGHTGPCAAVLAPVATKVEAHKARFKELGSGLASAAKRAWEIVTENVQGLVAGVLAVLLFACTPYLIAFVWPNVADAGLASPAAYLHALALALVIFFLGIFASWAAYQIDWKAFDSETGFKTLAVLLSEIKNPALKLCVLLLPYFLLLLWFGCSVALAASLLK